MQKETKIKRDLILRYLKENRYKADSNDVMKKRIEREISIVFRINVFDLRKLINEFITTNQL